ncbi:hypothetical protein LTR94_036706, partial [Friedmanniomyces endolithicus]
RGNLGQRAQYLQHHRPLALAGGRAGRSRRGGGRLQIPLGRSAGRWHRRPHQRPHPPPFRFQGLRIRASGPRSL